MSTENRDRISPRLVRPKKAAGRFWTCSNSRARTSEITDAASRAPVATFAAGQLAWLAPGAESRIG